MCGSTKTYAHDNVTKEHFCLECWGKTQKLIKFRYEWYEGDRDAMFICHPTKTTEEFYEDLKRIMIEAGKDNNGKI